LNHNIKGQKKEKGKQVEIEGVEEWEIKKILNKRKIREVDKYLVRWKRFTVEHNTWEKREDLGHAKETLEEFKGRMNVEIRRQEKLDMEEKKDFRRGELPEKYMVKMLYVSQIRYSLVVILGLNSVSEVQYKDMMIDR